MLFSTAEELVFTLMAIKNIDPLGLKCYCEVLLFISTHTFNLLMCARHGKSASEDRGNAVGLMEQILFKGVRNESKY